MSSTEYLPLDGLRVFIVEDHLDTKDLFTFLFESVGAEVKAAGSIGEALEILEGYEPDILVGDIALPDGDGCSLLEEMKLRKAKRGGNVLAIAVTAAAMERDRVRVLAAGFLRHLSKPIEPEKLVEIVARLAGREGQV